MQYAPSEDDLALPKAGKSKLAKIAMMAMTTKSSIKVKPALAECRRWQRGRAGIPERAAAGNAPAQAMIGNFTSG
jgi:hypothetical protein